jgi:hypothetical protein
MPVLPPARAPRALFARFLKSMTETRTQGRRDIRLQTPLLPKTQAEELPFGGW